jgi:hypothetical protein
MASSNTHIDALIAMRAELIRRRRVCVKEGRSKELPDIVAQIEAADRSIVDEKILAETL